MCVFFFFMLPKCKAWSFINFGKHLATWAKKKTQDKWIQNRLEILINRMAAAANQDERFSQGDNNQKKEPINIIISISDQSVNRIRRAVLQEC